MEKNCPFCEIVRSDRADRTNAQNDLAISIKDSYPISEGHTLIIPKRHIASFFDTTQEERQAMLRLVDEAKVVLDREYSPAAYNLGINDGSVAGQTVPHLHIHLIPRYKGDVLDPRGGIRWILPDKAKYWD